MTTSLPRIKSYYSLVLHSPNNIELRMGVWNPVSHYLRDDKETGILYKIVKLLDGTHSARDIAEKLDIKRSDVESVIDYLNGIGALEFGFSHVFDYYLNEVGPSFKQKKYEISDYEFKPILFLGDSKISEKLDYVIKESFYENIVTKILPESEWSNILLEDNDWLFDPISLERKLEKFLYWKDHFLVLSLRHIDPNLASRLNRILYNLEIPWIHVAIDGPFLFIGPIFTPGKGPCYDCFEKRSHMNMRDHSNYQKFKQALCEHSVIYPKFKAYENLLIQLISAHSIIEIINYLLTGSSFIRHKALSIYLPAMEISFNEILRLSNCVTCGNIEKRDGHQLYFDSEALIQPVSKEI